MTEGLQENIEQLYAVFSKYPGNPEMEGSSLYGDLEKWNRDLFSKPLRKLSAGDLSRFSGKVITTWGDADDMKHFLPRILELTALLKPPYMIWVTFDRLEMTGWQSWPADEYETIKMYMLRLWDSLLSDESEKAESEFDNYFSTLAHFYPGFDAIRSYHLFFPEILCQFEEGGIKAQLHTFIDRFKPGQFFCIGI